MKNYLQNTTKFIYKQKRTTLFIFTIAVYIAILAFVKADAEAEKMAEITNKKTNLEIVKVTKEVHYAKQINAVNTEVANNLEKNQSVENSVIAEIDNTDVAYMPEELRYHGTFNWNGSKWTWYSEKVLPGGGLDIPGRYTDEDGFVCDEDDYICLAADTTYLSKGTVVDTPFGRPGKIYDCGCAYGTIDVYVGW